MSQEMDISWAVLRGIIRQWAGASAELAQVKTLDGGCISTAVLLELTDGAKAVCKISAHRVDRSYVNEAHQLGMLSQLGLPVPRVYAAKVGTLDDPFSYILMEFREGINLNEARKACNEEQFDALQSNLAEMMLTLHSQTSTRYSRAEVDPKPEEYSSWPEFLRHIFDPLCKEISQSPLVGVKPRKQIAKVMGKLDQLVSHSDIPRLVHWDVWAANLLCQPDASGKWAVTTILDPSCKYAHAEAELAYMALFHTITPTFAKTYQRQRRLPDEYHRIRKPVYQLFFLMNHVCLFGAEYVKPLLATLDQIEAVM